MAKNVEPRRRRIRGVVGAGLALGALVVGIAKEVGPVPLSRQQVRIAASPDRVYERMTAFDEGPRVLERQDQTVIAEFPVQVGWYRTTTRERITLDPNRRRIAFEQLRPPFFTVRAARETFELTETADGGTEITLTGVLWPTLGVFGWLVTRLVVRPRWDRIDAAFLDRTRRELAPNESGPTSAGGPIEEAHT